MSLFKVGDIVTPNFIEGSCYNDYAFGFVPEMRKVSGFPTMITHVKKWPIEATFQPSNNQKYHYLYDGYDYELESCPGYHFSTDMFLEVQNEI